jgi:hypothetical protein
MPDVAPKEPVLNEKPAAQTEPGETKPKRGRPAGSTFAAKSNQDVDAALSTLETAYQFVALGLTMIGAPMAAAELAGKLETVQAQNKGFLLSDRKLAQTIARIGQGTGRAGFITVNAMALVPVITMASSEIMTKRRAANPVEPETETETNQDFKVSAVA